MSEKTEPTVYTSEEKSSIEDYKFTSDFLRKRMIERLEGYLEPVPSLVKSDITIGYMVLGSEFAKDYLRYLKNGGDLRVEGFYRFRWEKNQPNKVLSDSL